MKLTSVFFFCLLLSGQVSASNLCNDHCLFTLSFPDGGILEAREALGITFGADGELNLGTHGAINSNLQPSSLDFSSSGELQLAAGDSITFGQGGLINLGISGGNINYTELLINSTGYLQVAATGGDNSLTFEKLSFEGDLDVYALADLLVINTELQVVSDSSSMLIVDAGSVVNHGIVSLFNTDLVILGATVNEEVSACEIQNSGSDLKIQASTISVMEVSSEIGCQQYADSINSSTGTLTVAENGLIQAGELILNLTSGEVIADDSNNNVGDLILEVEPITQEFLSDLPDGMSLVTENGNDCVMSEGSCYDSTGQKYVVVDGELVPENNSGGGFSPITAGWLLSVFLVFRLRRLLSC